MPEACAIHFGIDRARWAEICRREFGFFHASAYVRFDSKFRNERADAYLRARAALQEGRDPSEAQIPGWNMPPKLSASHRLNGAQERVGNNFPD